MASPACVYVGRLCQRMFPNIPMSSVWSCTIIPVSICTNDPEHVGIGVCLRYFLTGDVEEPSRTPPGILNRIHSTLKIQILTWAMEPMSVEGWDRPRSKVVLLAPTRARISCGRQPNLSSQTWDDADDSKDIPDRQPEDLLASGCGEKLSPNISLWTRPLSDQSTNLAMSLALSSTWAMSPVSIHSLWANCWLLCFFFSPMFHVL